MRRVMIMAALACSVGLHADQSRPRFIVQATEEEPPPPPLDLVITTTSLSACSSGVASTRGIVTTGGTGDVDFSVSSGTLGSGSCTGVSLDAETGDISCSTGTSPGTCTFEILATDAATPTPDTDPQAYALTISDASATFCDEEGSHGFFECMAANGAITLARSLRKRSELRLTTGALPTYGVAGSTNTYTEYCFNGLNGDGAACTEIGGTYVNGVTGLPDPQDAAKFYLPYPYSKFRQLEFPVTLTADGDYWFFTEFYFGKSYVDFRDAVCDTVPGGQACLRTYKWWMLKSGYDNSGRHFEYRTDFNSTTGGAVSRFNMRDYVASPGTNFGVTTQPHLVDLLQRVAGTLYSPGQTVPVGTAITHSEGSGAQPGGDALLPQTNFTFQIQPDTWARITVRIQLRTHPLKDLMSWWVSSESSAAVPMMIGHEVNACSVPPQGSCPGADGIRYVNYRGDTSQVNRNDGSNEPLIAFHRNLLVLSNPSEADMLKTLNNTVRR